MFEWIRGKSAAVSATAERGAGPAAEAELPATRAGWNPPLRRRLLNLLRGGWRVGGNGPAGRVRVRNGAGSPTPTAPPAPRRRRRPAARRRGGSTARSTG